MSLFLCVDCGGSKTSAVITDRSGRIVGRATGGPSNFACLTASGFSDAVGATVSDALKTSVLGETAEADCLAGKGEAIACAWFGIAGVDSPAAVRSASRVLSTLLGIPLGPRLVVTNDTHLLAAPLRIHGDIKHAVAVIAGTGSCVVSFERDGTGTVRELARIGGWGWMLGDEGSGFHVGRETVRQMMYDVARTSLGMEGTGASTLKAKVLERFGIERTENVAEVLAAVHLPGGQGAREKRLSELAPAVFEAAFKERDKFGLKVLEECAGKLAEQIGMLCRGPGEDAGVRPRGVAASEAVLCYGGSLVGVGEYRALIEAALGRRGHVFKHVRFVGDAAALGAESLASLP